MKTTRLIAALMAALLTLPCSGRMKFRSLEVSDGLSSNHVNAIHKDANGAMWFGTSSGLNRWDGYSVTKYQSQPGDSTRLHDNYIQEIQEDAEGRLWINAGDRYSVYDPRTDRFRQLSMRDYKAWGLDRTPNHIIISGDDFWISAYGHGVVHFSPSDGAKKVSDPGNKLGNNDLTDLVAVPARNLVVAVDDQSRLFIIDAQKKSVIRTVEPLSPPAERSHISLFVDREGWAWAFGLNGVLVYDIIEHEWIPDIERIAPLRNRLIKTIGQDKDGAIWIGYDNAGIDIFDKQGHRQSCIHDPSDHYSLGNNSVLTIYSDNTGGMWIGTYKRGISVYSRSEFKFDTTLLDDVNCLALTPAGYVLVGTDSHGLMKLDTTTHAITPLPDTSSRREAATVCITPSRNGGAWIGTYNSGLKYFNGSGFRHYTTADGLASNSVWGIIENPDGTLYIGTLGGGLQIFDTATGHFTSFNAANSGLCSNYINTLCKSPDGKLFMGTTHGIAILDPGTRIITSRTGNLTGSHNFGNQNVNQLMFDSRKLLWVVTREGLNAYDIKNDTIYDIELRPESPRLFVLGITEDNEGAMWVSVDGELIKVAVTYDRDKATYRFRSTIYDSRDGIQCGTFNQRSFCNLPSGEILAGGLYGITHIVPDEIHYNKSAPHIRFTGLSLDNRQVTPGTRYDGRILLPETIQYLEKIELNHDQTDITISFATDNYIHPDRTSYSYRLIGLNDTWNECPEGSHSVSYANLPPGKYTLEVCAVNNDGVKGETEARMEIVVHPPFWWTWWAKTIYIILAISALALIIGLIRARERRRFAARRKEELAQKQEELNQLKFRFFTNISHELRTPLTLILSPVESMLKENPDGRTMRRLTTVRNNATRLLYLVNQLLDFRKNEMSGLSFHPTAGDLVRTVGEIYDSFAEQAERQNIRFTFVHTQPRIDMTFDADKLTKTIINLISNALKYTPEGGEITVEATLRDGNAVISVADTGRGIDDKDKPRVFERFYQSSSNDPSISGSGIGLSLVHEYVKLHDGEVTVEDNTPHGALFRVTIPVRQPAHQNPEAGIMPTPPAPETPAETEPQPQPAPPTGAKPNVLLVDDNYDMVEFLIEELADEFNITGACDGADALEKINRGGRFLTGYQRHNDAGDGRR